MVRRRTPELVRARSRILFFALLTVCLLPAGNRAAVMVAMLGLVAGLVSLRAAVAFGPSYAITFIAVDWLVLGLAIGVGGGLRSWLAAAIPLLAFLDTLPGGRQDWLHRLAPAASLLFVLLAADPDLGGHRGLGVLMSVALVGAGALPVRLLHRPPANLRRPTPGDRTVNVDPTTGFSTIARLTESLTAALREATADHEALNVVCVRIDHLAESRTFLGAAGAEEIVAEVARRLRRRLRTGDLAFRVCPDTLVLVLRDRLPSQARLEAVAMRRDVALGLVERQRQTISTGVASFPAARDVESLLREAQADLLQAGDELLPAASQ